MPTLNLGKVRPVYKGTWDADTTYEAYDWVLYNGAAYIAITDAPAGYQPDSQAEVWGVFGGKGDKGEKSDPGTPGAQGPEGAQGAQGEQGPQGIQGEQGVKGTTFIPSVDADGNLSWENDGGLSNPDPINIKGPVGPSIPISDALDSESSSTAASSKAVKAAYDKAAAAQSAADTAAKNSDTADKLSTARTISLTGDVTGSKTFDGSADADIAATLKNSGVTAGNYGPSANATPGYGATFQVPFFTVDEKGRVTSAATRTVKIPAASSVTNISGNAATATRLQTARTITVKTTTTGSGSKASLIYNQSGSVSFNGTGNVTINVPIVKLSNCNCDCGGCGSSCFIDGYFTTVRGSVHISELIEGDVLIDIHGVKHKVKHILYAPVSGKRVVAMREAIFTEDHIILEGARICAVNVERAMQAVSVYSEGRELGRYIALPDGEPEENFDERDGSGLMEYLPVVEGPGPVWADFSGVIVQLPVTMETLVCEDGE